MQSDQSNTNLTLQLQSIYSTLHFNTKDDSSTLNLPSFDELDYGQKLVANHNILKDLILVVDNKIAGRQAKKSQMAQPKREGTKATDQSGNEPKFKEVQQKQPSQSRLREKMLVVREKLKEIIQYINSEAKSDPKMSRKDLNLQQIKEISSQYEPSLQYSRDKSQLLQISKEKITIDKSKLQNAKEVVSHEFLHPEKNQLSNRSYAQPNNYMKSSLERISEVQSGQNVTEKDTEQGHRNKGHSKMNSHEVTAKNSLQLVEQLQQLDETGKIILSTINKKTTTTTTIHRQKSDPPPSPPLEPETINQAHSSQEGDSLAAGVKKNRFWLKNVSNPIQHYSKNTVVSHESLEDSKVVEKVTKTNLKIAAFNGLKSQDKLTLPKKSIEKLPQSTNHRSPVKPHIVNNSAVEIQSSQMIPLSNNMYLAQKSGVINQNSIIYNSQTSSGSPIGVMRLQRQPSLPNVRQSRIVQQYQRHPNIIWRPASIKRQEEHPKPPQPKYHMQNRVEPIRPHPEIIKYPINISQGMNTHPVKYLEHRSNSPPPRATSPNNYVEMRRQNSEVVINQGKPTGLHHINNVPITRPYNFLQGVNMPLTPTSDPRFNFQRPRQSAKPQPYPQYPAMPPKPYRSTHHNTIGQANQVMMHKYQPSLDQIIQTSQHSYANSAHRQSINNSRVTAMDSRSNRAIAQSRASRSGSRRKGIQLTTVFPAS